MTLVDTDVLIAHLRGSRATAWLEEARTGGGLSVSVVSVAEVVGGMRSPERTRVWRLLDALRPVEVTDAVARRAGEFRRRYRRSHAGIELTDYLIAATAEVDGLDLATLNVKHYPMFRALRRPFDP